MLTRSSLGLLPGRLPAIHPGVALYVTLYQTGSAPCLAVAVSFAPWGMVATWLPDVDGWSRSLTPMGLSTQRPSSKGPLLGEGDTAAAEGDMAADARRCP